MDQWEENLQRWLESEKLEKPLAQELHGLVKKFDQNKKELEERFYKDLEFGTGGLRGLLGAGTNRLNIHTVKRTTQGLCDYITEDLNQTADLTPPSVAIGYDSRINSRLFAESAASVFAANGIKTYFYEEICPVPAVSFAVRKYGCIMGVMITASHNPAEYNGYKVYEKHGHQITDTEAKRILRRIVEIDMFSGVSYLHFEEAKKTPYFVFLGKEAIEAYEKSTVETLRTLTEDRPFQIDAENEAKTAQQKMLSFLKVAYSPLHGAGNKPVQEILKRLGLPVENLFLVHRQEKPDGNFPTCPYPNPEKDEAMSLVTALAEKTRADVAIATDPDCDRMGVVIKRENGQYRRLSGNEAGLLMLEFLLRKREEKNRCLTAKQPVIARTIVTSALADRIAEHFGAAIKTTPTGFKYIGELIDTLTEGEQEKEFLFGFEESCGYLAGTSVCEKDGALASALICLAAAEAKAEGITLEERLAALYEKYGYAAHRTLDFGFSGIAGKKRMEVIFESFTETGTCLSKNESGKVKVAAESGAYFNGQRESWAGQSIKEILDYRSGIGTLPPLKVLEYRLTGGAGFLVRPSGTEPKLKIYISVYGRQPKEAEMLAEALAEDVRSYINKYEKEKKPI